MSVCFIRTRAHAHLGKLDGKEGDEERVGVVRRWFVLRQILPKNFRKWTMGGAMSAALLAYKMSIDYHATHLAFPRYICGEGERSNAPRL